MAIPGEINHVIGQAYQHVLLGALEHTIRPFSVQFHVHDAPEKTSFLATDGSSYSFDFCGSYRHPIRHAEVLGECKGYKSSANLLDQYREFVAKAFVTSRDNPRHAMDFFWFITNVPFACSEGREITKRDFLQKTLTAPNNVKIKKIIGLGHVDAEAVRNLSKRIGVFILTDSFLKETRICYNVSAGENLWTILKKIHGGHPPSNFGSLAKQISADNELRSPDHIISGKRIRVLWKGID